MIEKLRNIIKAKYIPLNTIEIIKDNIISNLNYLYSLQNQAEMFPVLKSNAYGHGLKEICKILKDTQIKMVAVDSFPEAQVIYKKSNLRVLIMSEMPLKVYKYCNIKRTEFTVYNQETLRYLSKLNKKIKIHLFVNTGMNREGIDDIESFIENNKKYLDRLDVCGFCSHLAEADNSDSLYNKKQEKIFFEKLNTLNKYKIYPKWIHLGNSAGIFNLNDQRLNAFRPGISFYGYNPFKESDKNYKNASQLKPALRVFSTIIAKHRVLKGERISYDNSLELEDDSNIALIPFGYYEGLDRLLSNCAKFLFSNNKDIFWVKIAGKVCMNLTCLNFLNNEIILGKRVNLISEINGFPNSVENISKNSNKINYETLVSLNSNIKRLICQK